jgi:AraC-like DNA-binding protein
MTGLPLVALTMAQMRPAPGRITVPDVCCDLVWSQGKLALCGPMTKGAPSSRVGLDVLLLRIDPIAMRSWLGVPLDQLADRTLLLADIDPRRARAIEEWRACGRLGDLVVSGPASQSVGEARRMRFAANLLCRGRSLEITAAQVALSPRQLERRFEDQFGMSPKRFARIQRLRRTIEAARSGKSLAVVAAWGGYSDQPHFSRETRALTGATPVALLRNVGNVQDVVAGAM